MFIALLVFAVLVLVYSVGPRPRRPDLSGKEFPFLPSDPALVEGWLAAKEARFPVRPDNQARVIWAGKPGKQAPWCILYLHGYSASWREGAPVNVNTAKRYGANLLLTRLSGHGLVVDEALVDLDAQALWDDTLEAVSLAHALGQKVLIMATSSGAPLALQVASRHPDLVDGLVLYSPNVKIRAKGSGMLSWPWGLQLARLIRHSRYNGWEHPGDKTELYWYNHQRLEGAVQLQALLDASYDRADLAKVKQPVYIGVYYRDEAHQDSTVDVGAARSMVKDLGTPADKLRWQDFGDAGSHVIACDLTDPYWQEVQAGTWKFLEEVMGWKPVMRDR